MKTIDCRNMACPMPVVTVKKALEKGEGRALQVLLDDGPPRENVARFATGRGYVVEERIVEEGYALVISGAGLEESGVPGEKRGETVLLITSDRIGDGPEDLGRLLMKNFIFTLLEVPNPPGRIVFLNTGVFLTTSGSEVLEALDKLGNSGVEVLSCGVCLDFFNRKDKLEAGVVTNMFTAAESLLGAGSVVRL